MKAIASHKTVLLKNSVISQIFEGARDGSARAYIEPALNRSNLDVLVNTLVTKVVQTGTKNDLPVFRGVQFAQNNSGMLELRYFTVGIVVNVRADTGSSIDSIYSLNASREVILSAGAVQTPHLRKR